MLVLMFIVMLMVERGKGLGDAARDEATAARIDGGSRVSSRTE